MSTSDIKYQLSQSRGLLPYFKQASRKWNISLAVLLAVASRETKIGTDSYYLANNFTGRDGHGKGVMQIDDRYHEFAKITAPNDHKKMIDYGAQFLSELKNRFGNVKHALVAYNAGPDAIYEANRLGINPDLLTTGGNYSADVIRRSKIIKKELGTGFSKSALPAFLMLLAGGGFLYHQYEQKGFNYE